MMVGIVDDRYCIPVISIHALYPQNGMTCAHIAAVKGSVAVIKELMRFNKQVVTTARNKVRDMLICQNWDGWDKYVAY